jgi:hypothetical protein
MNSLLNGLSMNLRVGQASRLPFPAWEVLPEAGETPALLLGRLGSWSQCTADRPSRLSTQERSQRRLIFYVTR